MKLWLNKSLYEETLTVERTLSGFAVVKRLSARLVWIAVFFLCALITVLRFVKQLYVILSVFLLNVLCSLEPSVKCVFMRWKNCYITLVVTELQ